MPDYAIPWKLLLIIAGIFSLCLFLKIRLGITKRKKNQMELLEIQKELEDIVKIRTNDLVELNKELNNSKKELYREKIFSDTFINSLPGTFAVYEEGERLIRWNKNVALISGYSEKKLSNLHPLDWLGSDEEKKTGAEWFRKILDNGETITIETDVTLDDGRVIPILTTGSPLYLEDKKYAIWTAIDISDRKKIEEQLGQAQKMESLGTLAGGIAHDFNNILSAIIGYGELARIRTPAGHKAFPHIKQVIKAGKRAKGLVQQILAFSRHDDQDLQPLKIQLVIKEALKLLRSTIPSTIEINQDIDLSCGPVLADPTQIHQIIMNLCTNAYYAMKETGGRLGISLKHVNIANKKPDNTKDLKPGPYVKIEISDNGPGMTEDIADRIFEPYFTTKTKEEGTGLGLAVVHGIVNTLHGDIIVNSEPGRGTVFHIYLPMVKKTMKKTDKKQPPTLPGGNERILIVDDDKIVSELSKEIFEDLGYHVTACTNSVETLNIFQKRPDDFDLLITDMTMPDMTGAELVKEIHVIRPDMPIILCTGFSEQINEKKAMAMGIKKFLMKPVAVNDFARAVRKTLDGE